MAQALSNRFLDFKFICLVAACLALPVYQYSPLVGTLGYNVGSGKIIRVERILSNSYERTYRTRPSYIDMLSVTYSYQANGNQLKGIVTSVPIIGLFAVDIDGLRGDLDGEPLAVRYDPEHPHLSVPVQVIQRFFNESLLSSLVLFVIGLILITLTGLSNLSGERWQPGMRTDTYY